MGVNKDGLAYKLAYTAVFLTADIANASSQEGVNDDERESIITGILDLLDMTEEDVDGDGVVDRADAREIFDAACQQYDSEYTIEGKVTENVVAFNYPLQGTSDGVKDWVMKFYQNAVDAEDRGSAHEAIENNVIEILRKAIYGED